MTSESQGPSFASRNDEKIQSEIKSLRGQLDKLADERLDDLVINKFYDTEPSGQSGPGQFELSGIETTVSPTMLLRLFSTEPYVYAAVMAIAETIAGIPWKLEKSTTVTKQVRNEITGDMMSVSEETWSDATGSKLYDLFQFPNPFVSRSEFLQYLLIDLIVTGDSYTYLDSDQDLSVYDNLKDDDQRQSPFGRLRTALAKDTVIKGMYRIPTQLMTPVPKTGDEGYGLHGYVMESENGAFGFLPAEIVHIKFPNPLSYWNGLSPLMAAILRILLERYATEHMLRFYKSGARLGGMIETDKNLNKEQITRLQRSFENDFTGRQNFYRTLVLPNGMKYKPVEQNPIESSVIELGKMNREAILSVLRVPPIKVGIMDNANYANANVQLKIFYDDTIKPRCAMVQDGFNMKPALMPDNRSYRIRFDFTDISVLQENYKEKADAARSMIDAGLSVDEVRKIVWKSKPVAGGDMIKVIEDMRMGQPVVEAPPVVPSAASGDGATAATDAISQNQITDPTLSLNGAQVTAMANIVSQIAQGYIPRATGVEMIIVSFSVPRDAAERVVGTVGTPSFVPARDPSAAPADSSIGIESGKDLGEENADPLANLPGPVVTSIMNIVGRVTRGKIAADAGCAMIAAFGLPADLAHKLVGLEYTPPAPVIEAKAEVTPPANQPELADQIKPTGLKFEERVAQLTAQLVSRDKLPLEVAIARAIETATLEGLAPGDDDPTDPNGGGTTPPSTEGSDASEKPTVEAYMAEQLAQLDAGEEPSQELIDSIMASYEEQYGPATPETPEKSRTYAFGVSKDQVVNDWKSFISKTDPMVEKRKAAVSTWFKKLATAVKNELGANLKAYGMFKSRDSEDADEITDIKNYEALLAQYVAEIDASLSEAYKMGYTDTLVKFTFDPSNDAAKKALQKYGASRIKGITDTTMEQIKTVLTQAFEEGVSISETSQRIDEKFAQIESGRAETIARTETLSAVSIGRQEKREDFQKEFPDAQLQKMWVSAQDDRVRDSHQELDGTVVDADAEFKAGLRFPRDPNGAAEEVINCRCTEMTFAKEDQAAIEATLPKKESDEE